MTTVRTAAALIASLTLMAAPVLTACSQSTPGSGSSGSAASDSSTDSTKSGTKNKDSKNEKTSANDASPSQTDRSAKPAPGDSQEATGPTTGLTFALPKDWADLKNLDPSEKETVAQTMGLDSAALDQQTSVFDVFYRAKEPGGSGFYNNVNMASQTLLLTSTPSEPDITPLLTQQSATLKEYSTKQTANGEAAVGTYTMQGSGKTVAGAVIMVPTSQPAAGYANYATIYVSASSAEEEEQITNTILDTIH